MIIPINLGSNSYDIIVERSSLNKANEYLNLNRKVLIVTDDGVPTEYSQAVFKMCKEPTIVTIPKGEGSKSLDCFNKLLTIMLTKGFTRKDAVVAVGGGVVGDLAGFVAASFMRGVDFYNIPTTLLSQIDSSIGGKTAINFNGVKNIVGAFYQPKCVIIDPELLKTLNEKQLASGFVEAIKMSLTSNEKLFNIFEEKNIFENLDEIIIESLQIKKQVVEQDEKEQGLRKVLNFGHTLGHGIESELEAKGFYHGECVALGMLPMWSKDVKLRLLKVLEKLVVCNKASFNKEMALKAISHDKKSINNNISVIKVNKVGEFIIENETIEELSNMLDEILL